MKELVAKIRNTRDIENLKDRVGEELGILLSTLLDECENLCNPSPLALAEAQILGFKTAKQGHDIIDLISAMGLTKDEWWYLKNNYGWHFSDFDKEQIEEYFKSTKE